MPSAVSSAGTAHGLSSGRTTNLPRFARTLTAVAEHLGPVHSIVAHSLGAPAAAFAMGKGLKADRLVMVAPPAHPRRFISGFWRQFGIPDPLGERMIRRIETTEGARLREIDVAQSAQHVGQPVFVVHDRTDKEVPFIEGEEWSWAVSDGQLLATEGLGHNRLLAAPMVVKSPPDVATQTTWAGRGPGSPVGPVSPAGPAGPVAPAGPADPAGPGTPPADGS